MPFKDTESLAVTWRNELVVTATVDRAFINLLNKRNWHPASLDKPSSPRTSVLIHKKPVHLVLSRVVFVLSKFEEHERILLWEDTQRLYEYCRRVPDLGFFNLNPFDNTVANLKLKNSNTPITNVSVDFESKMVLPLTALFPQSGLKESSKTELSEPVVEALREIQKAPTIEQITTAGLENDPNVISEMFHALEEDTLGGPNVPPT